MKIKKLIIHNIASIQDATIDFDAEPLRGSNVFLIAGKTGAGKTTILDAICLALYNSVARLTKINDSSDKVGEVSRKDTRNMMRRGTTDASVRLTFVGIDKKEYEAIWEVRRARDKADGKLQDIAWIVKDTETGIATRKQAETGKKIEEVVGLSFDQFCRTTMLAQGEFTKFLKSTADEKSGILEKIVGAELYSKVGAKIAAITSEKKSAFEDANRKIDSDAVLTEEQIETDKQRIETLKADNSAKIDLKNKDGQKLQWLQTESACLQKLANAQKEYEEANRAVENDEFKAATELVEQWHATIAIRQLYADKQSQERTITQTTEHIDTEKTQFLRLLSGMRYIETQVEKDQQELNKIADWLQTITEKQKEVFDNATKDLSTMQTIISTQKSVETGKAEIAKLRSHLPALEKALADAQKAEAVALEKCANKKTEWEERQKELDGLRLNEVRTKEKECIELSHKIENAEKDRKAFEAACETRQKQEAEIKTNEEQLRAKELEMSKAEGEKNSSKTALDRLCNTESDTIKKLRLHLHVGDHCPVCQAMFTEELNDHLPTDDAWDNLVKEAETAYQTAETNYNDRVREKNKLSATIEAQKKNLPNVQEANDAWENDCKALGIEASKTALAGLRTANEQVLEKVEKDIEAGTRLEETVRNLQKEYNSLQDTYNHAHSDTENQKKTLDACATQISNAESACAASENTIQSTKSTLTPNLWKVYAENEVWSELRQKLEADSKHYHDQKNQQESLAQKIKDSKLTLAQAKNGIERIVELVSEWKGLPTQPAIEYRDCIGAIERLKDAIVSSTTTIENAKKEIQRIQQKISDWLDLNPTIQEPRILELNEWSQETINARQNELKKKQDALLNSQNTLAICKKEAAAHQEKKPQFAEEETEEYLAKHITETENGIGENNKEIGSIEEKFRKDAEIRKKQEKLREERDKLQAEYDKWQSVNALFGTNDGAKFRTIAQSYILDYLIHAANVYMQQLNERYILTLTPGTFIINVEDTWAGYTQRAINTLSGGETFMVSLALALALSDIGSRQLQVDTLFIDEGFGTLSGEALNSAIDMLQDLHSKKGRRVGIISHVDTVKEKIPVHIEVEKNGNSSYSTIKIETSI